MASVRWVALLRAIGPASHRRMSMADLRDGVARAGLGEPRTILATGNLLVTSDAAEAEVRAAIEGVVQERGLDPQMHAVILRRAAELGRILAAPAFPGAAAERPARCLVVFLDREPDADGLAALAERTRRERLALDGRELTIDYADGVGSSRLTVKAVEGALKATGTGRNWTTIGRLHAAAG